MIYTNQKALEQISILFGKTTDELEKEIQSTSKEEWIGFSLDIETPTYLKQVKKYGKSSYCRKRKIIYKRISNKDFKNRR